jgi:hypothetical protein
MRVEHLVFLKRKKKKNKLSVAVSVCVFKDVWVRDLGLSVTIILPVLTCLMPVPKHVYMEEFILATYFICCIVFELVYLEKKRL